MSTVNSTAFTRFDKLYKDISDPTLGNTDRLRGTKDAGGTRIFQRTPGSKGNVLERTYNLLFGRGDLKSNIDKALDEVRGFAETDPTVKTAIAEIKTAVRKAGKDGRDLQAGAIKSQLDLIQTSIGNKAPSISHTPSLFGKKGAIQAAMSEAKAAGAIAPDRMVATLSKAIAKDLNRNDNVKFTFSISTAEQYKKELVAALKAADGPKDDAQIREIAHRAYEDAVAQACDIRLGDYEFKQDLENGKNTGGERPSKVDSFTMGGVEYKLNREFGTDSSPSVVGRYEPVGGGKPLILKLLRAEQTATTKAGDIEEMANEAIMQRHLNRSSPENIGRLENVLRLPDGRLALIMEYAPHGDLHGAVRKLPGEKSIYPGQAESIRRTLAKDILQAAAAMEDADVNHTDIKGPNFFINEKGKACLADFGTARFGAARKMFKQFQNMTWNDPQARLQANKLPQADAAKVTEVHAKYTAQIEKLENDFEAKLKVDLTGLSARDANRQGNILRAQFEREHLTALRAQAKQAEAAVLPSFNLDAKAADRWSLGTVLWEIYSGTSLFDVDTATMKQWGCLTAEAATDMAHDKFLAMSRQQKEAFLFDRPGMPEVPPGIQEMILGMLDNDPAKRMSPKEALAKEVLADKFSVGSPQVRKLLIQVMTGKAPDKKKS